MRIPSRFYGIGIAALVAFTLGSSGCARRFTIKSDPNDAEVYLNGGAVGKTPITIPIAELPQTQNIKLEIRKLGYGKYEGYIPGPTSASLSSELNVAIPKNDDDDKVNKVMVQVFRAQGLSRDRKPAEALKVIEDALKDNPRAAPLHFSRASILFIAKNFDGAKEAYQKVLEVDGTNGEALRMLDYIKKKSLTGNSGKLTSNFTLTRNTDDGGRAPASTSDPAQGIGELPPDPAQNPPTDAAAGGNP